MVEGLSPRFNAHTTPNPTYLPVADNGPIPGKTNLARDCKSAKRFRESLWLDGRGHDSSRAGRSHCIRLWAFWSLLPRSRAAEQPGYAKRSGVYVEEDEGGG